MRRRQFIARTGLAVGAGAVAGLAGSACTPERRATRAATGSTAATATTQRLDNWDAVRAQFDLDPRRLHFAAFVLASHPRPVREAIDAHRRGLDADADRYLGQNESRLEAAVLAAATGYLGVRPGELALTDSTTMGLGLLYGGLRVRPGQELLATEHDFYSTHEALRLAAARTGASFRKVPLYHDLRSVTADEIVGRVRRAVGPRTRALAVTWVHSSTGLKLPVRAVADALAELNRDRDPADRTLLCVDAVHALGVEPAALPDLGCDFLVAGCHKWLFGPRGTGIVWGRPEAWPAVAPTIPPFDGRSFGAWIQGRAPRNLPPGAAMTPGGYHSFEYRWALGEAFGFHERIGKDRVAERTWGLARQLKQGLRAVGGVRLVTPLAEELSAGVVCFDVDGLSAPEVRGRLLADGVVASVTPYAVQHVRLGTSIVTSPAEVDQALRSIAALA